MSWGCGPVESYWTLSASLMPSRWPHLDHWWQFNCQIHDGRLATGTRGLLEQRSISRLLQKTKWLMKWVLIASALCVCVLMCQCVHMWGLFLQPPLGLTKSSKTKQKTITVWSPLLSSPFLSFLLLSLYGFYTAQSPYMALSVETSDYTSQAPPLKWMPN